MTDAKQLGKHDAASHISGMSDDDSTARKPTPAPLAEEANAADPPATTPTAPAAPRAREIGGPKGPEPTRYGDWEIGGRCSDF